MQETDVAYSKPRDNTMDILNQQLTDVAAENQYLAFRVGGEQYAVEVLLVQEIIRYVQPTRVPNSPPVVKGVINFRGKIIPVIDLRKKFGLPELDYDSFTVIIVLEINTKVMGMIVDSVADVVSFSPEEIQVADDEFALDLNVHHVQGLGRFRGGVIQILAPARVLAWDKVGPLPAPPGVQESGCQGE